MNKMLLILGAVAAGAVVLTLTGTSSAAQGPTPPGPLPPPHPIDPPYLPPNGGGSQVVQTPTGPVTVLPTVTVYGDPAALAWNDATLGAAKLLGSRLSRTTSNRNATAGGATLAFQKAYNADPTSKHPENMLGSASAPVFFLKADGFFGSQSSTALMYVTGEMFPG